MQTGILLTLKLQQRLFADPRRIALLRQIDQTNSISQRAKHADINYESVWNTINEMSQLSEQLLVDRAVDGKGDGGTVLIRYRRRLIQLYDLLAQIQQKVFDVLSDDDTLPLDSLLTAISRFSLQTNARNQWLGTIASRDRQQVQQHVKVLLVDGWMCLTVAITAQGAERPGLDKGQEVLVLLKTSQVGIILNPAATRQAGSQLSGRINHIECGSRQYEVLMTLADGQTLCATLPQAQASGLAEETEATVYFNADRIILATLCRPH